MTEQDPITAPPAAKRATWKQDPEAVKADILAAARQEFAAHGLTGTRIQDIAEKTRTSKRMIFYYFGDKEGLYQAVLEHTYAEVMAEETALSLEGLEPGLALARLVAFMFDHHRNSPEFIRLVMIENIHMGAHLKRSDAIRGASMPAMEQLAAICRKGAAGGTFHAGLDPLQLHWQISALSFFNLSNRPTFGNVFAERLFTEDGQADLRQFVILTVLRAALRDAARAEALCKAVTV